ncbi:MAG: LysR family transcriptional regulator [Gemmatimonadaceae bacterium]
MRVRLLAGSAIALGPGKADLLHALDETGSIAGAARRMRMSYRRAWLLVRTINDCFDPPLVEAEKGGVDGGGARLTDAGREVLARYHELVGAAERTFRPYLRKPVPRTARGQRTRPRKKNPVRRIR